MAEPPTRSDAQDLAEFVGTNSPEAFARLSAKYARMVYGTCLRRLGRPADAEDASQAVFLVLARRAASVRAGQLGAWLHGVAVRVCMKTASRAVLRTRREEEAGKMRERTGGEPAPSWEEIRPVLDGELARLPVKLREAVVGHYLTGRTYAQLAAEMGVPEGTAASRVHSGLVRLRTRLGRCGVSLGAAALGGAMAANSVVEVPASLLASLPALASGAASAASPAAAGAAQAAMSAIFWGKVKTAAIVLCATAAVGLGGGAALRGSRPPGAGKKPVESAPPTGKLNPRLAAMADNTWLNLKPERNPKSRTYSGNCFGDGKFYYFGGGHFSYTYNDVELYDPVTNTWTQVTKPERPAGSRHEEWGKKANEEASPTGAPYVTHTYQYTSWDPVRKRFFLPYRMSGVWEFDPAGAKWENLLNVFVKPRPKTPHDLGYGTMNCILSVFEPRLGKPLLVISDKYQGLYEFDYEKESWTKRGPMPKEPGEKRPFVGEFYATYVDEWKAHLFVTNRRDKDRKLYSVFSKWDLVKGTAEMVESPKELGFCEAVAYDSANKVVIAMPVVDIPGQEKIASWKRQATVAVWALDVKTMKWTEMKPKAPTPTGEKGMIGFWAPLWYDPAHNVHLFMNFASRGANYQGGNTETWAYRYGRAAQK